MEARVTLPLAASYFYGVVFVARDRDDRRYFSVSGATYVVRTPDGISARNSNKLELEVGVIFKETWMVATMTTTQEEVLV
jgi:hypothetical protein